MAIATLKALFFGLCLFMLSAVIYTISVDGLPFRSELLTPWLAATLVDFYFNIVPLAVWIWYKSSHWTSGIVWLILLICLGSVTSTGYVFIQLVKLSPQDSQQDPIYHILLRDSSKDNNLEHKRKHSPVVIARCVFGILGLLMLGTLIYFFVTAGSPFRKEVYTPWMIATLIDFYVNVFILSVWVVYKETSWFIAFLWIILIICFGSIATGAYLVHQLLCLSSQDPLYLVLLNSRNRAENWYERT